MTMNDFVLSAFFNQTKNYNSICYAKARRLSQLGERPFSSEFLNAIPELQKYQQQFSQTKDSIYRSLSKDLDSGKKLLIPGHLDYPKSLLDLEEMPFLLRMQGNPIWKVKAGLAVVGSRDPRGQSLDWMEQHLKFFLRATDCFISSGGARGIDQKAHHLAIEMERPTIVFIPSGLDKVYPPSLMELRETIIENGGAFISEYESDVEIRKHHFIQRNRLISGIACATLIVEAKSRSGTMITANEALEQNRPIWALPGHPLDCSMAGNNSLIFEGATPIFYAEDLISLFSSEALSIKDQIG